MANFRCPKCGHDHLQVINETNVHTSGKNYSSSQGCLGYLLLGPLGLLCGSCGQKQQTTTTNQTYWVCSKCGNKFRDPNELRAAASKDKVCGILLAVVGCLGVVLSLIGMSNADGFGFLLFLSIMVLIMAIILLTMSSSKTKEVESIQNGMANYRGNGTNRVFSQGNNTPVTNSPIPNTTIYCSKCGEKIVGTSKFCTSCGNSIKQPEHKVSANEWKCPKCGVINQNYVGTCGCGEEKPR